MMKGPGSGTMRSGVRNRIAGVGYGEEKCSGLRGIAMA